ncbi:MAG: hypothetical protein WCP53_15860, partial [Verrucomicrobiota bacterium]
RRTLDPVVSTLGTNDLTQTALGRPRDDSGRFLPGHGQLEIVKKNPFAAIDLTGVGQLMPIAIAKGWPILDHRSPRTLR